MLFFILKRLAQSVLVMAVVSAVSFSLFNFVGDPVNNMVGQDATREQRIEIRQQLGLDDPDSDPIQPVYRQYGAG